MSFDMVTNTTTPYTCKNLNFECVKSDMNSKLFLKLKDHPGMIRFWMYFIRSLFRLGGQDDGDLSQNSIIKPLL